MSMPAEPREGGSVRGEARNRKKKYLGNVLLQWVLVYTASWFGCVYVCMRVMHIVLGHKSALQGCTGLGTTWGNEMNFGMNEKCPRCRTNR